MKEVDLDRLNKKALTIVNKKSLNFGNETDDTFVNNKENTEDLTTSDNISSQSDTSQKTTEIISKPLSPNVHSELLYELERENEYLKELADDVTKKKYRIKQREKETKF